VVAQPAHEAARRRSEPALVMPDEADDVVVCRVGLRIRRRWNDPCRGRPYHVRRQLAAVHKLIQGERCHCRAAPWQQIQHRDWLGEALRSAVAHRDEAGSGRKRKGAQPRSEGKKQRAVVLSDEVRDFPSPSPWIYRSGEATLPKNFASCALTAGGCC
jgi:hypothetical protein